MVYLCVLILLFVKIYVFLIIFIVDIPLVPSLITADPDQEPNFILHWLNNKEMHFSLQAEALLHVSILQVCRTFDPKIYTH
jgi:hypothetical protein